LPSLLPRPAGAWLYGPPDPQPGLGIPAAGRGTGGDGPDRAHRVAAIDRPRPHPGPQQPLQRFPAGRPPVDVVLYRGVRVQPGEAAPEVEETEDGGQGTGSGKRRIQASSPKFPSSSVSFSASQRFSVSRAPPVSFSACQRFSVSR